MKNSVIFTVVLFLVAAKSDCGGSDDSSQQARNEVATIGDVSQKQEGEIVLSPITEGEGTAVEGQPAEGQDQVPVEGQTEGEGQVVQTEGQEEGEELPELQPLCLQGTQCYATVAVTNEISGIVVDRCEVVCEGNFVITSAIEARQIDGCTVIKGNLRIDIIGDVDYFRFRSIRVIEGTLTLGTEGYFLPRPEKTSFNGFENLIIANYIEVVNRMPNVTDVSGFRNLIRGLGHGFFGNFNSSLNCVGIANGAPRDDDACLNLMKTVSSNNTYYYEKFLEPHYEAPTSCRASR